MKKLMLGAQVLAPKLEAYAGVGEAVGVMLPNSAGVAVVFAALQGIGRVPAMINFSSGVAEHPRDVHGRKGEDRADLEGVHREGPPAAADRRPRKGREDRLPRRRPRRRSALKDKIKGLLAGLKPRVQRKPDDPAVILFTSGSEGTPKGVVLSHRNMLVNIAQGMNRAWTSTPRTSVFNALPVFHSFGLTVGTIMPLVEGVPLYMYPTPLHYRIIPGAGVRSAKCTIMFGTDTFLNGYARAAHPYDMRKVRIMLAGAEAVKERTRQMYMDKFGVRIFEGYGVTETSPGLAMGTPLANKSGTLGRIVPLMRDSGSKMCLASTRVQGDMQGRPPACEGAERHARLLPRRKPGRARAADRRLVRHRRHRRHRRAGLHASIMGRAKRFAKIGGEMVSLSAVEALASEIWPAQMPVAAHCPTRARASASCC